MNRFLLKIAMLPAGLYRSMGADVTQLQALLKVKLLMDDRKPLNLGRRKAQKKPTRFSSFWTAFVAFFTGIIYVLPLIGLRADLLAGLWAYFTFFLFMLSFTLITDFSSVLLDTRDKYIVLPRPVNGRTLLLSRLLHIFIYLVRIVVPMSLPGWITLGYLDWRLALWFPIPLLLLVFTALFLVMALYLLMLTLTSPRRFKGLLNTFQIVLSILLFSMYYLVPQLMKSERIGRMTTADIPWIRNFPSYWIGATSGWVSKRAAHGQHTLYYSLAAILFPVIAFVVTLKWLAPKFTAKLAGLDGVEENKPAAAKAKSSTGSLGARLANLFNRSGDAKAGFLLAWLQTGRSRTFRMRVYPTFAYVPVYFAYLLFAKGNKSFDEVWQGLPHTARHIGLLYMCAFVLLQTLNYLVMSDQYKAAWIYYAVPLQKPGMLLSGAFKAVWVKFFLPFFLVISCFVLYVWGINALPDIALALVNVTLFAVSMGRMMFRHFPFSKMEQMKERGTRFFRVLLVFLIPGALGFAHYLVFLAGFWWLKVIYMFLSFSLLYLFWDSYKNTSWAEMKVTEDL